jgi:hypothetical protein
VFYNYFPLQHALIWLDHRPDLQEETMQRKTGEIRCWNCGRWIAKKGNLCPFCGKNKAQSRQLVEVREDRFINLSGKWLIFSLLFAAALWVAFRSPLAICAAGTLLFMPGLVVSYFWTGMAGG